MANCWLSMIEIVKKKKTKKNRKEKNLKENFFCVAVHCWNYRRYVAKNIHLSIEKEFDFTTQKINDNFSNYSAWHQRSALLPQIFPENDSKLLQLLKQGLLGKGHIFKKFKFKK